MKIFGNKPNRKLVCIVINDTRGSSFIFVLILITVITLVFGIIVMGFLAQHKYILRNYHKIQARYNSEAGLYTIIDSLQKNINLRLNDVPLKLEWGDTCYVTIKSFGGFLQVNCFNRIKNQKVELHTIIGEKPNNNINYAFLNSDDRSHLTFTGDCIINGRVKVGKMGIQIRPFKGKKFTGSISGPVEIENLISIPAFHTQFFDEAISLFDRYLFIPPPGFLYFDNVQYSLASQISNSDNVIYYSDKDIEINNDNRFILDNIVTVISKTQVTLADSVHYQPGSIFIAKENIEIKDYVTGDLGLFYAENIDISMAANCSGQFLATNSIKIKDQAILKYPSVLYLKGIEMQGERSGSIELSGYSVVEGTIIYPSSTGFGIIDKGKIYIGDNVQINGVVYCANQIEFQGIIEGCLLTYQSYFYDSPTHYINWLRTGYIDNDKKRSSFCLPLFFSDTPQLGLIKRQEL